jgi:hypothetical protein
MTKEIFYLGFRPPGDNMPPSCLDCYLLNGLQDVMRDGLSFLYIEFFLEEEESMRPWCSSFIAYESYPQ